MADKLHTGDIFLVRFHPSYGAEFQKYRPAVVVSSIVTTIDPRFVLIAPLSTNLKTATPDYEFVVKAGKVLEKDSLLLCWYLWTIDTRRLVKKLGVLTSKDQDRLHLSISKLFPTLK